MILIITNRQDQTADYLILELKRRKADYLRFNTEDFPQSVKLTWKFSGQGIEGYLAIHERILNLCDIKSVWFRRPVKPQLDSSIEPEAQNFVTIESMAALDGLWKILDCLWVSKPDHIRRAENKLFQLKQAAIVGFQVFPTVVTNDPIFARSFYEENENDIVYKPLSNGRLERGDNRSLIFTNPVDVEAAEQLDRVKYSPCLLQKYVHKKLELRVTVIGDKVFAVSLDSQKIPKAIHDWRKAIGDEIPHSPYSLPVDIENKCRDIVHNLGLEFGAIDLILTPDEKFIFLEINPNGQWAWIQQICPQIPLRESLADLLMYGRPNF